nr:ribonuclease H-like domain, reverse transcriptase, RNA-dependent DNA polymerase [Tanacetum cinerariifolium]
QTATGKENSNPFMTELSRIGYEKPSTKLTFYKAFFSPQWKFLIHTILQCMSTKRTSWNEFSSSMALAVICLSTGRKFNFSKYIFDSLQADDVADEGAAGDDVDVVLAAAAEPSIPSPTPTTQSPPPSQELPSTSQVIPTPPPLIAEPSSPPQQQPPSQPTHDAEISMDLVHTLLETCTTLTRKVEALEQDKVAQAPEIIKLKQRVKQLERKNKLKVFGLKRLRKIIAYIDADDDVILKDVVVVAKEVEVEKTAEIEENANPAELKEVVEVVTTAKLMTEVVTATSTTITAATTLITAATITDAPIEVVTTAKLMTEVVTATSATITAATTLITAATITDAPNAARRRKRVVIRDLEETATPFIIIHSEPKSKDKGKGIIVEEPKPLKKQAQIEQDEAYAR